MTMTSGMWFSTASIITACCMLGVDTCMRRALPDSGMGDVAVAGDLVGRVDDDDALVHVVGEHPRDLSQHRRLAHAGSPQQQRALARSG